MGGVGSSSPLARLFVETSGAEDLLRVRQNGGTRLIVKNDGHVGIGSIAPTARLDVDGSSSDPYAIEATIFSSTDDVAAIYGDATGNSSVFNSVHGVLGRADGGSLGSRGVLGIMDRNAGGTGRAAVEGRFTQGASNWGNFQSGVYGTCDGAYGVHGVGNEVTIFNGDDRPGCGVRGQGYGVYTGSSTAFYPATGVWGSAFGDGGHGVRGEANVPNGIGVLGQCDDPSGFAGSFEGRVVSSTSNGGSFAALNPGNQGASVKLDWFNNVARVRVGGNGSGAQGGLDIQTTGDTSLMRIQHDGDVGIGTTTPEVRLHVPGGSDVSASGGGFLQLGSGSGANIALDSNEIMARNNGAVATLNLNVEGGDIVLGDSGTGSNVGIGTSSPAAKLEVQGPAGEDALRVRVNGTTRFLVDDSGQVAVGANISTSFDLQVSSSAPNGGTAGKPGGGSWSNSSDRRLKKNIADLDGALDTLLALRGVTFEYIDPEAINELPGTRTGFIAQEVETVIPDWVDEKPDGMKMLTVRGFEALAVEALRELERENADLRRQNADLTARLERLEALAARFAAPGAGTAAE